MPFAAFMSLALYHPQHGYYTAGTQRVGWRGHFLTSPELDPGFALLWARGFERVWQLCERPERFEIVEVGPGEASFAEHALRAIEPPFADAVSYTLVERSPQLRERQEQRLASFERVRWVPSITEVPRSEAACVFANEVLDNLPVHLIRATAEGLREVCVGAENGGLAFVELPPSSPELARFLERCGVDLPEGQTFEVTLAAESFAGRVASMFDRGAAVFVDYGGEAEDLVMRPAGTTVAYSERGADDLVLESPGQKDITSHANWTAVATACRGAGLDTAPLTTQRDAMSRLGLRDLHERLRSDHDRALAEGRGADAVAALSRRQALGALADPGGLGGLQVLVAARGFDPRTLLTG